MNYKWLLGVMPNITTAEPPVLRKWNGHSARYFISNGTTPQIWNASLTTVVLL
jgi:hypothetical protein